MNNPGEKVMLFARAIHQQLALKYSDVELKVSHYWYEPGPVLESDHISLYWDRLIVPDRAIIVNRPDTVVVDWSKRRAMIVGITVPACRKSRESREILTNQVSELGSRGCRYGIWTQRSLCWKSCQPIESANGLIAKSLKLYLPQVLFTALVGQLDQECDPESSRYTLTRHGLLRRFLSGVRTWCLELCSWYG